MATAWVLTKGMVNLRKQTDARFPGRDKTSDGSIGDLAHQLESNSGHNPDLTGNAEWRDGDKLNEVRAIDIDADLHDGDVSAQEYVDHLRHLTGVGSVIRYIIYNRKIYEASNGFAPMTYTGPSPHTEHIHVSGARSQASDENETFDFKLDELGDDVPVSEAEMDRIAAKSAAAVMAYKITDYADPNKPQRQLPLSTWIGYFDGRENTTRAVIIAAINAAAAGDDVDEAQIIAGILAGLTPEKIAAAIPAGLAAGVVNELRDRLATTGDNS
jgi:hypothetical protein